MMKMILIVWIRITCTRQSIKNTILIVRVSMVLLLLLLLLVMIVGNFLLIILFVNLLP